jgi:hypothetical protein
MPRKMARSGCATTVRACGMVAAVGTARQSCGRAGKAPILMPTRVSSGESRLMTLAMMTRVSLGHTGQKLAASAATQMVYLCVLIAALACIAAAFEPSSILLHIAALAWILAFGGFAGIFGPLLLGRPHVGERE